MKPAFGKYWIVLTGVVSLAILGVWAGLRAGRQSGDEQARHYEATARDIRDRLKRTVSPPQNGSSPSSGNDRTPDPRRQAFQTQIDAFRKANSEGERRDALERIMAFVERDPELLAALLSQLTHDPREPNFPAMLRVNPPMLDPLPLAVARLIGERHLLEASLLALRRLPPDEAAALLGFFCDCSEQGVADLRMSAVVDRDVRDSMRLLFADTRDENLKRTLLVFIEENANAPDIAELLQKVVIEGGQGGVDAVGALIRRGPDSAAPFLAAQLHGPSTCVEVKAEILSALDPLRPGFASVAESARPLALNITSAIPAQELDHPTKCLYAAALGFLGRTHDPEGARIAKKYVLESSDKSLVNIALVTLCDYPTDETARYLASYAGESSKPLRQREAAIGALSTVIFRSPSLSPYLETLSHDAADPSIRHLAEKSLSRLRNP